MTQPTFDPASFQGMEPRSNPAVNALTELAAAIFSGSLPTPRRVKLSLHGVSAHLILEFARRTGTPITFVIDDNHKFDHVRCAAVIDAPGMDEVAYTLFAHDIAPRDMAAYAEWNSELAQPVDA